LYRWVFRGGRSAEAYRALVAALADWLLVAPAAAAKVRAIPESLVVANGLPLSWRWVGTGPPSELVLTLRDDRAVRRDTLSFDGSGRGMLYLPPGIYRYAIAGGDETGVIAVETYSDEWRPRPLTLKAQSGTSTGRGKDISMRDRWWLFVVAIAAFAAEWAWRRRQGLP
jgi:hypothetical protein